MCLFRGSLTDFKLKKAAKNPPLVMHKNLFKHGGGERLKRRRREILRWRRSTRAAGLSCRMHIATITQPA
jgi:hypothetical protein